MAIYRLVLAGRAVGTAKSDKEEYVAVKDLMRAAVAYAHFVSTGYIPPPQ